MKTPIFLFLFFHMIMGKILNDYHQSNLRFTKDFYEELSSSDDYNLLFSPASLQTALAVIAFGGHRETQKQLSEIAHFHSIAFKVEDIYLKLRKELTAQKSSLISHVDIYIGKSELNYPYDMLVRDVFNAAITTHPFPLYRESFTNSVFGLSTGIIIQHRLTLPETWTTKFRNADPLSFHLRNGYTKTIDSLHVKQILNYYHNVILKAEFLEIPITQNEITLTIVLPSEIIPLSMVERHMPQVLRTQRYQKLDISVTIPKYWHNDPLHDLVSHFLSMGVTAPFSKYSGFTSITGPLSQILKATQTIFFNLSIATSKDVLPPRNSIGSPESEMIFTADRPFLYYIKHSVLGVIAIGKYANP